MALTREEALEEVVRIFRSKFDGSAERAEEVIAALEVPEPPEPASPEFLACIEAAKAGAEFQMDLSERRGGRRRRAGGYREIHFDSRPASPKLERQPDLIQAANRITYEALPPEAFRPEKPVKVRVSAAPGTRAQVRRAGDDEDDEP